MSRRHAFSLIELLVVIGIIGVLVAMLLPSLSRAREQANTLKCASQLHQLGVALSIYVSNHEGRLPSWSGWHVYPDGSSPEDDPGLGWTEQLMPYYVVPTDAVYHCPAFPDEFRINYFLTARWTMVQTPIRFTMKLSDVRLATQFVLSGDCTTWQLYPPPFGIAAKTTDDCDKDDATQEAISFFGTAYGMNMHRAGNNVLFADCHVEALPAFDPRRMTYHPTKMQDWASVTP